MTNLPVELLVDPLAASGYPPGGDEAHLRTRRVGAGLLGRVVRTGGSQQEVESPGADGQGPVESAAPVAQGSLRGDRLPSVSSKAYQELDEEPC